MTSPNFILVCGNKVPYNLSVSNFRYTSLNHEVTERVYSILKDEHHRYAKLKKDCAILHNTSLIIVHTFSSLSIRTKNTKS